MVNARGDATVADIGMHSVGKVDRRRTARQSHDPALGREHVNLVREKIDLNVFEKLGGIAGRAL